MALLSVGPNNLSTCVCENPPDLVDWRTGEMRIYDVMPEIEAFDLSPILKTAEMNADGRIKGNACSQFVMGVKKAMAVDRDVFDFHMATMKRLRPSSGWYIAGIGRHQLAVDEGSVASGGDARTGLEDNIRLDKTPWCRPTPHWSSALFLPL